MSISVVIPYYNSANCILRTLESIKRQSYLPTEVIIVDDGSEDCQSARFLENKREQYPFLLKLLYHKRNQGAPAARNTGVRSTNCEYIAFIDSDDCWVENKLESQLKYINEYELLYSNYAESIDRIDSKKRNLQKIKTISYLDILKKNLSPVTLLAKRSSIISFDERLRRCDDFKMSIEALVNGIKIGYLDEDLSYGFKGTIGDAGLTKSLFKMSFSYLRACVLLIREYPRLFFIMLCFIFLEFFKFPIRCLRVYFIKGIKLR